MKTARSIAFETRGSMRCNYSLFAIYACTQILFVEFGCKFFKKNNAKYTLQKKQTFNVAFVLVCVFGNMKTKTIVVDINAK